MRTLNEPFWLIDNIGVKTWYYRDAPAVGSTIRYTNESFIDTVERVTPLAIWFASGHMMRRPYLAGRLFAWITAYASRPKPKYKRLSWKSSTTTTATSPRLRPDMTVLPV